MAFGENSGYEVWEELDKIQSKDSAFLALKESANNYRLQNSEYHDALRDMESGKTMFDYQGNEINKYDLELTLTPAYFAANIKLRNEINQYLENNKANMTGVEYQAVVKAYEKLAAKINDDVAHFGEEKCLDLLIDNYNNDLKNPKEKLTAESAGRIAASKMYIVSLKREYLEAQRIINDEKSTREEKDAATKWKEDIFTSLYSGKLEENIDNFIQNNPVGQTFYNVYKDNYNYGFENVGINSTIMKSFDTQAGSELNKIKHKIIEDINKIPTNEGLGISKEELEANREKAMDMVYKVEELCDLYKVGTGINDLVTADTADIKISKDLIAPFNDKMDSIRQKFSDDFEKSTSNELDKEISEYQKKVEELESRKRSADGDFYQESKNLEAAKARLDKAKKNYEMIKSAGFVSEEDRGFNERVYKHEENEYRKVDEKYGAASSKASRTSMELDRAKSQLEKMRSDRDKVYFEKIKKNPYIANSDKGLERGTHKLKEVTLSNGEKTTFREMQVPGVVKATRLLKLLQYFGTGKLTKDDYYEALAAEEENFKNMLKAQEPIPIKNSVSGVTEPGAVALDIRKQQLGEKAVNKEEPTGETLKEEVPAYEEEIDYTAIELLNEAKNEVKAEENITANPTFEETHKGLVSLENLVNAVEAGNKGVWFGSKEYDNILLGLKAVKDAEDYLNNADMDPDKLRENREQILENKKFLGVQIDHYLKRKNSEKDEREANDKTERANSTMRRELMEGVAAILKEHIDADEKALGIEGTDRFYENTLTEIKYLKSVDPKNKKLGTLFGDFSEHVKMKPMDMMAKDRVMGLNVAIKEIFVAVSKYDKDNPVKADLLKLGEKTANRFLNEIAENFPDKLDKYKDQFKEMNKEYGINIDTSIQVPDKAAHSYDDILAHQNRIIKDQSKGIFREELIKKTSAEEWTFSINNEEMDIYEFKFDDFETKAASKIVAAAYKSIYASNLKEKGIIYDSKTFEKESKALQNQMKTFKKFNSRFSKNLCAGFNLNGKNTSGKDAYSVNDIDWSIDKINEVKNETFKEMLISAIEKLGKSVKEKQDEADIMKNIYDLDMISEVSQKLGCEKVYNSKIKVDNKELTVRQLEDLVRNKAGKLVESGEKNKEVQKGQAKREVKPSGLKK